MLTGRGAYGAGGDAESDGTRAAGACCRVSSFGLGRLTTVVWGS